MRARLLRHRPLQPAELAGLRTLSAIDDRITAPSFGFGDAANYYRTQSAIRYLDGLRVPALLIQAKDDTFVPFDAFDSPAVRVEPLDSKLLATDHGGHLGFVARRGHRFWVDDAIMGWFIAQNAIKEPALSV